MALDIWKLEAALICRVLKMMNQTRFGCEHVDNNGFNLYRNISAAKIFRNYYCINLFT